MSDMLPCGLDRCDICEPCALSIESDGTPQGTRVLLNGRPLLNVKGITWRIDTDNPAVAQLTLVKIPVRLQAATVEVAP